MRSRGFSWRPFALSIAVGLIGLAGPSSASAATQIGEVFTPTAGCSATFMDFQSVSPQDQYVVPFDGVITSWSFQASANPPQQKVKFFRPVAGNDFTVVGDSALETPAPSTLSSFSTRISVKAGDLLGRYVATNGDCVRNATGYTTRALSGSDASPGTTATFSVVGSSVQIDIAATLEQDADADGFGDETQDQCPTDATTQGACPPPPGAGADTAPPDTTITCAPKKRRNRHSIFSFASSEPGSSFRCSLDNGAFESCSSPQDYRNLKRGSHTFAVVATDAAGNVDPTPATADWKVKKKKKK